MTISQKEHVAIQKIGQAVTTLTIAKSQLEMDVAAINAKLTGVSAAIETIDIAMAEYVTMRMQNSESLSEGVEFGDACIMAGLSVAAATAGLEALADGVLSARGDAPAFSVPQPGAVPVPVETTTAVAANITPLEPKPATAPLPLVGAAENAGGVAGKTPDPVPAVAPVAAPQPVPVAAPLAPVPEDIAAKLIQIAGGQSMFVRWLSSELMTNGVGPIKVGLNLPAFTSSALAQEISTLATWPTGIYNYGTEHRQLLVRDGKLVILHPDLSDPQIVPLMFMSGVAVNGGAGYNIVKLEEQEQQIVNSVAAWLGARFESIAIEVKPAAV